MSSFFEKLKKGMEIKELPQEPISEKNKSDLETFKEEIPTNKEETPIKEETPTAPTADDKAKNKKEKAKKITKKRVKKKRETKKKKIKVKKEISTKSEEETGKKKVNKKEWLLLKPEGELTVDVYQTEKEIVIQSAIAGIETEDLEILVENDMLTIKGNRERPPEKEERNYFYQECHWGPFSREIILPAEVDSSRAQASLKKGILTIRIPKIEKEKKRTIIVEEYEE